MMHIQPFYPGNAEVQKQTAVGLTCTPADFSIFE
jgi:hypothetical protein